MRSRPTSEVMKLTDANQVGRIARRAVTVLACVAALHHRRAYRRLVLDMIELQPAAAGLGRLAKEYSYAAVIPAQDGEGDVGGDGIAAGHDSRRFASFFLAPSGSIP